MSLVNKVQHLGSAARRRPHDPARFLAAQVALCAVFAAHGFIFASWAVRVPAVKEQTGADTGLGLANLFPAAIARAGLLAGSAGVALTSLLGYSGFLLGPPAIGFLAGAFGLSVGLTTLAFLALAAAAIAYHKRDL